MTSPAETTPAESRMKTTPTAATRLPKRIRPAFIDPAVTRFGALASGSTSRCRDTAERNASRVSASPSQCSWTRSGPASFTSRTIATATSPKSSTLPSIGMESGIRSMGEHGVGQCCHCQHPRGAGHTVITPVDRAACPTALWRRAVLPLGPFRHAPPPRRHRGSHQSGICSEPGGNDRCLPAMFPSGVADIIASRQLEKRLSDGSHPASDHDDVWIEDGHKEPRHARRRWQPTPRLRAPICPRLSPRQPAKLRLLLPAPIRGREGRSVRRWRESAERSRAVPEASASQHPRLPQEHCGPVGSTVMCPISPR